MVSKGIILPKLPLFSLPIALTMIFVLAVPASALEENGVIEMPFTENPPAIDGKFTTADEWSMASETSLRNGGNVAYLYTMHDRDKIYVFIDAIFDKTYATGEGDDAADHDVSSVCFDRGDYGTDFANENTICFLVSPDAYLSKMFYGNSEGLIVYDPKIPIQITKKIYFGSENSPHESGRDHMMYEFAVNLSYLSRQDQFGFFARVYDANYLTALSWPEGSQGMDDALVRPSTHGTIKSMGNFVTAPPIPVISVSAKSISFGDMSVSDRSSRTITISNVGSSLLKISSITPSSEFSVGGSLSFPIPLEPNQSMSFEAIFAPLIIGEKSGTIKILSNDISNPTYSIQVSGKGVEKDTSPLVGGGCLITTAAFGSELAPQVQLLRELRDNAILGTDSGMSFMAAFNQFYYSFSPTVADWERQNPVFKEAVKVTITPMLSTLSILNYVDIDSDQEMLGYGIGIILLNISIYFVAPTLVLLKLRRIDHTKL